MLYNLHNISIYNFNDVIMARNINEIHEVH